MSHIATTKMSSKGQIVIPEEIRDSLGLETGTKFAMFTSNDTIFLKPITPPSAEEFSKLLAKTHVAAKKAGLTQEDLDEAIKLARKKK